MKGLAIIWAQYGPYHLARVAGLRRVAGSAAVHAIELSDRTRDYLWLRPGAGCPVTTLVPGAVSEDLGFWKVFFLARRALAQMKPQACLLPSYWPKQSLAALLAAKCLGIRTVMMNETHAGTARATGLAARLKRRLLRLFDAALVGGKPQKRYFASLGLPEEKIFAGYDAVDNDYFANEARAHRLNVSGLRTKYRLPDHFFLSLGRFVTKKNLETLLQAYRHYLNASSLSQTHLVMVGAGPEEEKLKHLCRELGLSVYDKSRADSTESHARAQSPVSAETAGVHFYGFRQIEENPIFYALGEAFVLPSLYEEWGLVVNEAMASGLPVVVSHAAGCAEDLLELGEPEGSNRQNEQLSIEAQTLRSRVRRNGFVFDPRSSEELGHILRYLERHPQARAAMGQESARIAEKFSCENFGRNALLAAREALGTSQPEVHRSTGINQETLIRSLGK